MKAIHNSSTSTLVTCLEHRELPVAPYLDVFADEGQRFVRGSNYVVSANSAKLERGHLRLRSECMRAGHKELGGRAGVAWGVEICYGTSTSVVRPNRMQRCLLYVTRHVTNEQAFKLF